MNLQRSKYKDKDKLAVSNELDYPKNIEYAFTKSLKLPLFFSFVLFLINFFSLQHSISVGESVEVLISACNLKDTLSFDHSLSVWITKLSIFFMVWGSPAYKMNLLTAILNSASAFFSQVSVLRLTDCYGSSLMVISLFYVSKMQWILSSTFQMSSLSNFFISFLILMCIVFEQSFYQSTFKILRRITWLLFFICILSIFHDVSIMIYSIVVIIWVFKKSNKIGIPNVSKNFVSVFIICCLPFLLFMICISPFSTIWNIDLSKIIKLQTTFSFSGISKNYMEHMQTEMCELSPWLFLIGIVTSISWLFISRNISCMIFILMFVLKFTWACLTYDLSKYMENKEMIEGFMVQCNAVSVILTCIGFHTAIKMVTEKFLGIAKLPMTSVFTTMGALILFTLQLQNYRANKKISNLVIYDYAENTLKQLPQDSIVLTYGLLSSTSLRYLQSCEDIRTDLKIINFDRMYKENSLNHLKDKYDSVIFPGNFYSSITNSSEEPHSFNMRKFIGSNLKKYPIFLCSEQKLIDISHIKKYKMIPYGTCRRFDLKKSRINIDETPKSSQGLMDNWKHQYEAFPLNSWENVANNEMWHAKIALAFFLYREAEYITDDSYKSYLLTNSFEIYMRQIKLNQHPSKLSDIEFMPKFWHKNFALVCERLLHVDSYLERVKMFKLSIFHFQQYVHLNPTDEDAGRIYEAIEILKEKLALYQNLHTMDKTLEKSIKRAEKIEEMVDQFKNKTGL